MNSRGPNWRKLLLLSPLIVLSVCPILPAQRGREPLQFPPSTKQPVPKTDKSERSVPAVQKIRVEEGRITADIVESPMHNVLKELAERTGIIFEARSQDNPPVSIHLKKVPLEEAVQRITSGRDAIFLYGPGSNQITTVRIFPRSAEVPQPSLVYLGTGVVTKSNKTVETPEQALQALSEGAGVEDREVAIEILVKNKSDAAVKALEDCISDPAPEIRAAAIEGLAAMGARAALPKIQKGLKDEHPGVRQSAVSAVSLLGDSRNLKDLKPLRFDRDSGVAAAAENAIRKLSISEKK
jgi:hypothetical protein